MQHSPSNPRNPDYFPEKVEKSGRPPVIFSQRFLNSHILRDSMRAAAILGGIVHKRALAHWYTGALTHQITSAKKQTAQLLLCAVCPFLIKATKQGRFHMEYFEICLINVNGRNITGAALTAAPHR